MHLRKPMDFIKQIWITEVLFFAMAGHWLEFVGMKMVSKHLTNASRNMFNPICSLNPGPGP